MPIYIKSSNYSGLNAATSGSGSGWMLYHGSVLSGSNNNYIGSGIEMISKNGSLKFQSDYEEKGVSYSGSLSIYGDSLTTPMISTTSQSIYVKQATVTGSLQVTGSINLTGSLYVNGHKQYNFGQFYDTTTQSGSRNIPYSMKLNTTDLSYGVSITSNGSGHPTRITVANEGFYNLQFSAQLYNTNNSNLLFTIWFRQNGVDIPYTATNVEVTKTAGSNGQQVAAWNIARHMTSGSYLEIMWSYNDGSDSGQIASFASSSIVPYPFVPSVIATMTQIA